MDFLRDGQRRGAWNYVAEYRRGAQIHKTGCHAVCRHRGHLWRGARPHQGLGRAHHSPCWKLWRSLCAHCVTGADGALIAREDIKARMLEEAARAVDDELVRALDRLARRELCARV